MMIMTTTTKEIDMTAMIDIMMTIEATTTEVTTGETTKEGITTEGIMTEETMTEGTTMTEEITTGETMKLDAQGLLGKSEPSLEALMKKEK
jgi:hypothetical protein